MLEKESLHTSRLPVSVPSLRQKHVSRSYQQGPCPTRDTSGGVPGDGGAFIVLSFC